MSKRNCFTVVGTVQVRTEGTTPNGKSFVNLMISTDGFKDWERSTDDAPPVYKPAMVCMEFFGNNMEKVGNAGADSEVEITGIITSSEYNGKWYTKPFATAIKFIKTVEHKPVGEPVADEEIPF